MDDVTRAQVENALQIPVNIVKSGGQDLVEAILRPGRQQAGGGAPARGYELKEIKG